MEPVQWVVFTAVFLPFLAAVIVPVLHRLVGDHVGYAGATVALVSFVLVATLLGHAGVVSLPWIPSLGVALRFQVDGLSLLFALIASGIGVAIFSYSSSYMSGKSPLPRFYAALLGFMGSVMGVAFAADLIVLFLFWELTSICSFILIGFHTKDSESQYSARMAILVTAGGGLFLLVGIILLATAAQSAGIEPFNLSAILQNGEVVRSALREKGLFWPVLIMITIAAGAKSAQVPLHFWLPRAMVAPTPVSAFLHSATMVKVGVYLFGRLRSLLVGPEWQMLLGALGLTTMTVGALLAVQASDIKELLAYSTASHLGLITAAFGFQTHYGAEAGAFHFLNHAIFKATLFLVAGIVAHTAHTRRFEELGGLWRDLPVTFALTAVAAVSMAGIPPLHGFYSKELLFVASWEVAHAGGGITWIYPVVAVFASVFTVLYSLRFLWMFLGERPVDLDALERPSVALIVPPALLVIVGCAVTVFPDRAIHLVVQKAAEAAAVMGTGVEVHAKLPLSLSGPAVMSFLTVGIGIGLFPMRKRVITVIRKTLRLLRSLHPETIYKNSLIGLRTVSRAVDRRVHTGQIRTYVSGLLIGACVITLSGFIFTWKTPDLAWGTVPLTVVMVLGISVAAAGWVACTKTHVTGVLTLGLLGFMLAIFYILASAPDLALTQLVVETLLLLIFLIVLEKLPAFYGERDPGTVLRDLALSLLVGITTFTSVLVAVPSPGEGLTSTARYYVNEAIGGAGGANVVNVILTDFRAFDTLGEVTVVVMAALSILVLLIMRHQGEVR